MDLGTFLTCAWLLTGLGAVLWIAVDIPSGELARKVETLWCGRAALVVSVILGVLLGPVTLLWWRQR